MPALRVTLLASALLLSAPPLRAQEVVELDEVVITALRTAAERLRTGVSVSVVTPQDLEKARTGTLADYLATLPGISLTRTGPVGNPATLRVRGADGRYLAVYIDGIRVSDPSGPTVSYDFGSLLASDVGRIEILRGSQSALWGGSAVGGVISISTLAGLEEGLHQSVGLEAGTYGTGRLSYGLTQKTDRAELAFSATRFHTDGYSAAASGSEADGADITRLSFSGRYQVSDALAVGGTVFVQKTGQEYDGSDPLTWLPVDADVAQERREAGARLFAELAAGNTTHLFDLSFYRVERSYEDPGLPGSYTGRRLTLGWQGTTELSDALAFVYGADWSRESADYAALPADDDATEVAGVFAQAIWSPSAALDVSAALRADRDSDFGSFTSGRLAAAWRVAEGTVLHAAVARGYRAPSLDERYGYYPSVWGDFTGNPDLQPERSWSWELGVERSLASGATFSATLFRLEIDNLIRSTDDFSTLENKPGESVMQGLEIAASAPLGNRATLGLAYTWTDARDAADARLALVPRHNLTAKLDAGLTGRLSGGLAVTRVADVVDGSGAMPGYTLVDAQLGYDLTDRAQVYLRVHNLTDREYQTVRGYSTSGRAIHVGLQAKF